MVLASERGAARMTSTVRVVIVVLVVSLLTFDLGAIVVNIFQLDELSHQAAQSAAVAYRRAPTSAVVEAAVRDEVADHGDVRIERIALDRTSVWVTLRRPPPVVVVDRLPAVRRRIDMAITQEATLHPEGL